MDGRNLLLNLAINFTIPFSLLFEYIGVHDELDCKSAIGMHDWTNKLQLFISLFKCQLAVVHEIRNHD